MWTQDDATFHGRFFDVEGAFSQPRPAQQPPITIGGSSTHLLSIAPASTSTPCAPSTTRGRPGSALR